MRIPDGLYAWCAGRSRVQAQQLLRRWTQNLYGRHALPWLAIATAVCAAACSPEGAPAAVQAQARVPETSAPPTDLRQDELATVELFERTGPSVVYITTRARRTDWFRRTAVDVPQGTGTGFVWDDDGHVITNFHVLRGANSVQVVMHDQTTYDAEWIGGSPSHDLAVLRIDAPAGALHPVTLGNSDALRVGQSVYAIGNPFGLSATLTTGIVSALGRRIQGLDGTPIEDVIQIDAAINPGNSGGPLLDSSGRVIGINSQIASPSGASAGVGFAVPADTVRRVVPQLIETGAYAPPQLGIEVNPDLSRSVLLRLETTGVLVSAVAPNSGAANAGLRGTDPSRNQLGDIIQQIDGEAIESFGELRAILDRYDAGDQVTVTIWRDGDTQDVVVGLS